MVRPCRCRHHIAPLNSFPSRTAADGAAGARGSEGALVSILPIICLLLLLLLLLLLAGRDCAAPATASAGFPRRAG
jgi:hypothetical protein